jgi:hypothetical protein
MAGQPQDHPEIMQARSQRADDGEPIYSESRSVHYSGNSLAIGLTATGTNVLDVGDGDELKVEVHEDGFWIGVADDGE